MRTVLMAAIIAAVATPQFRSPTVNRAKGEYDRAVAKAKAEYDKAVAAAGERYAGVLHAEMLKATQVGELDNALAYRKEKERVLHGTQQAALPERRAFVCPYDNRTTRVYLMSGQRAAYIHAKEVNWTGTIRRDGDALLLDFADGKLDVLRPAGAGWAATHYKDAAQYPGGQATARGGLTPVPGGW